MFQCAQSSSAQQRFFGLVLDLVPTRHAHPAETMHARVAENVLLRVINTVEAEMSGLGLSILLLFNCLAMPPSDDAVTERGQGGISNVSDRQQLRWLRGGGGRFAAAAALTRCRPAPGGWLIAQLQPSTSVRQGNRSKSHRTFLFYLQCWIQEEAQNHCIVDRDQTDQKPRTRSPRAANPPPKKFIHSFILFFLPGRRKNNIHRKNYTHQNTPIRFTANRISLHIRILQWRLDARRELFDHHSRK